jgi:hypothetical protein
VETKRLSKVQAETAIVENMMDDLTSKTLSLQEYSNQRETLLSCRRRRRVLCLSDSARQIAPFLHQETSGCCVVGEINMVVRFVGLVNARDKAHVTVCVCVGVSGERSISQTEQSNWKGAEDTTA